VHRWPFWVAIAVVMTVFLVVAVFTILAERGIAPEAERVSVRPAPPGSVVDLHDWMGYPTEVARLRLYDMEREEVVWDARLDAGTASLDSIPLQPGPSAALPPELRGWGFDVVVPEDADSFELRPDTEYEVRVWSVILGRAAVRKVERSTRFVLGEAR
jgi:hypothetical protein